jgi:hypothetical protein
MQTISTIAHHIHIIIYPEAGQWRLYLHNYFVWDLLLLLLFVIFVQGIYRYYSKASIIGQVLLTVTVASSRGRGCVEEKLVYSLSYGV